MSVDFFTSTNQVRKLSNEYHQACFRYVTVGEIWAFVIGWNIILEHMLGAAAVARSWSGYLDALFGHFIRNETLTYVGSMEGDILGDYPDFIAFLVIAVVCCFMGTGSKTSTNFNSIFTFVNLGVIGFIIVLGFTYASVDNWTLPALGGFLPYGFSGVLAGAASCFFAYIGFDGIATSGEEAANPAKSIPVATIISMTVVTVCYCLMSSALTLMIPYDHIHPSAAFADAFDTLGLNWAKYIVAVGALSGMTTSLVGSLFALPRCVYAMANDGLIFRCLAQIHPRTQVPTLAVAVFGLFTSVIALLFDIETLVEFLSIGTLMAYTIVSSSVIILRYRPQSKDSVTEPINITLAIRESQPKMNSIDISWLTEEATDVQGVSGDQVGLIEDDPAGQLRPFFQKYPLCQRFIGCHEPGKVVGWMVALLIIFLLCFGITINYGQLWKGQWWIILITSVLGFLAFMSFIVINMFQPSQQELRFKVIGGRYQQILKTDHIQNLLLGSFCSTSASYQCCYQRSSDDAFGSNHLASTAYLVNCR